MLVFAAVFGCDSRTTPPSGAATQASGTLGKRPVIVASIVPMASLVTELVDDWAEVHTLIPPGTTEHTFDLSAEGMRALSRADVVVLVGVGLDDWIARKAQGVIPPKAKVLRFAEMIHYPRPGAVTQPADDHDEDHDEHEHHHRGGPNQHIWLDPVMAASFIQALGPELEPYFPERLQSLHARTTLASSNLLLLDRECAMMLTKMPVKRMVTFHNAFDLPAARYGLTVAAHLTELELSPGGEVSAERLVEAINAIRKYKLKAVYTEPQFPDAYAKSLSAETGVKVLTLDPLGDPRREGYRTYFEMMRSNLETLYQGQTLR
ncbi:MAG: metal ABC transporter substrate-binding protein [Planctomycetes bacterium]|nr:metal ABC transporter substrate-binding protein [Planctomycetota bacterium]